MYPQELNKPDVTMEIIEKRFSYFTKSNKVEQKLKNGEGSYFIKDQTPIKKNNPAKCF